MVDGEPRAIRTVLSIAGSDSGGGAGVQADLKAFVRVGVHGTTAITAITAQNTIGVDVIHPVPPEVIIAQVRAITDDIGVDAVKVGMLGDRATIAAVVEALTLVGDVPVVVDPVMVAESGADLLALDARYELIRSILPLASVLTPNLPEARRLAAAALTDARGDASDAVALAAAIRSLGPSAVVVTGGHADGIDVLDDGEGEPLLIPGDIHPDGSAHGSGCTHSSALAGLLARGLPLRSAAVVARTIAAEAIGNGLRELGAGPGPVDALDIGSVPPFR